MEEKTIHDPVHGSIRLDSLASDLLETAEIQRLRGIRQLGLANLVFPGANHTRFEHSLGVMHLANQFASDLGLTEHQARLLRAAALLHDVGHPPFSHTLELQMVEYTGMNHEQMAAKIIRKGVEGNSACARVLQKHGLDPSEICELIQGKHKDPVLNQLLHGEIDVDQMDYLLRDAHFTGVALGMIDLPRLRRIMQIRRGKLVIKESGIEAVEGFLTARSLMFSSVYFHRTVRIAELMLARAVEMLLEKGLEPFLLSDWQLLSTLEAMGGFPAEIVRRLSCRRLYIPVYFVGRKLVKEKDVIRLKRKLGSWRKLRTLEDEICDRARVPRGRVIIDIPLLELEVSESRIKRTGIMVAVGSSSVPLHRFSPLASIIQEKLPSRYLLQVATLPEYRRKVRKVVEEELGWVSENSSAAGRKAQGTV